MRPARLASSQAGRPGWAAAPARGTSRRNASRSANEGFATSAQAAARASGSSSSPRHSAPRPSPSASARVGAAQLDVALEAHLGEQRRQVELPVGIVARSPSKPSAMKRRNVHVLDRPVRAVAHDEEHRHVQRPLDVVAEREAGLEHERQQPAAILVGLEPDRRAEALSPVGRPRRTARPRTAR